MAMMGGDKEEMTRQLLGPPLDGKAAVHCLSALVLVTLRRLWGDEEYEGHEGGVLVAAYEV